jgi:7-carboxy-7-deazaguanine synthase
VIISGGEPTLQPQALVELARFLKKELNVHITLETNGVLFIPELPMHIDLFSISPKLKSSDPEEKKNRLLDSPVEHNYIRDHEKFRRNPVTLQKYINACMHKGSYYGDEPASKPRRKSNKDFQLKFVITGESDIEEIRQDFLDHLSFVEPADVLLMPVGGTPELLRESMKMTASLAIRHGFRYTPRLQIDLFGDTAGT